MEYSLSKTIDKSIKKEDVFTILLEKLKASCTDSSRQDESLLIEGFKNQIGGINYDVKALFSIKEKEGKTIINVNVTQTPSWIFWVLLVALCFTGFLFFVPIAFYFYGKKQITDKIHASLLETAEELG